MLRSFALITGFVTCIAVQPLQAQDTAPVLHDAIQTHILPRFETLAETTAVLHDASEATCAPDDADLRSAYHSAFDAWIAASHIRFGPAEEDERGYAMGFWPDPKGFTSKSLAALILDEDPIIYDAQEFTHVSIASRGFYALETLLYDPWIQNQGDAAYRCDLVRAVTGDLANNAASMQADWRESYAAKFGTIGEGQMHATQDSAVQVLINALVAGYQFTEEARLGRPLGTFERPRPLRAEARKSERSLRNVAVSLTSLTDLALHLSAGDEALQDTFASGLERALDRMQDLTPTFAEVDDVTGRLKVEILQQETARLREAANTTLAAYWGVDVGFNALDGD